MNYQMYLNLLHYLDQYEEPNYGVIKMYLTGINKGFETRVIKVNLEKAQDWFDYENTITFRELEFITIQTKWVRVQEGRLEKLEEKIKKASVIKLRKKLVTLMQKECYYLKKRF